MQHKADIICIIFVGMIRFAPHFCSVSQSAYTWVHTGTFFGYTLSKWGAWPPSPTWLRPSDCIIYSDWLIGSIFILLSRESDNGAIRWMNPHPLRSYRCFVERFIAPFPFPPSRDKASWSVLSMDETMPRGRELNCRPFDHDHRKNGARPHCRPC